MGDVDLAKGMKIIAVLSVLLTAIFTVAFQISSQDLFYTIAITAGTISYHFLMRLSVGGVYNFLLKNKVDYNRKWFRVGAMEQRIYKGLNVKKWKKHLPTYDPSAFDIKQHTWNEIAGAMCQAELVHETIAVFSFLPMIASNWFGATLVFALTSVFSALFDLSFAMMQRYNRPRVLKLIRHGD